MSIRAALEICLREYPQALEEPFADHPVASFMRNEFPEQLKEIVGGNDRYKVLGSPGKSKWAHAPWAAVLDVTVTGSPNNGIYVVYIMREDFSGAYLALGQGITGIRNEYGVSTSEILRVRANDMAALYGSPPNQFQTGKIDLRTKPNSKLGPYYEDAEVFWKFYPADNIPEEEVLVSDLQAMMSVYATIVTKRAISHDLGEAPEESGLEIEGRERIKLHKTYERSKRLADKAKRYHGYTCQACDFDFEAAYGELGRHYIEAHHLTPLASFEGNEVSLDHRTDFAVLCANCHRMAHRMNDVSDIDYLRSLITRR